MATKKLMDLLQRSIARELQVSIQYMWQHILWKGVEGFAVKDQLRAIAIVEMQHADTTFVMVLVGAMLVASMELTCAEVPQTIDESARGAGAFSIPVRPGIETLPKGAEIGHFNMGSTVIVLAPADVVTWAPTLHAGAPVRVGESIGECRTGIIAT